MTATVVSSASLPDDRIARRNARILAVTQALAGGNNSILITTGGIVGAMLAPDRGFATLPITVYVLGLWFGTLPMGWLAARFGRRVAFQIGTLSGIGTGLVCFAGLLAGSFVIFCAGAALSGFYAAAQQGYRFAATDTASEAFRPKAISWVLIGGIFGGLIGPQVILWTKDLLPPYLFAMTYLAQAALAALAMIVLSVLKTVPLRAAKDGPQPRPLGQIASNPRFILAVVCGVASYGLMNLVMTAAPIAMVDCGISVADATLGIQWHILAMFVPSLITGRLITRFGADKVVAVGLVLIVAAGLMHISGLEAWRFWVGLILLGVGWNFGFIGASAIVTECHLPHERVRVQSFNDFLVFGAMAVGSFSSGQLVANAGWNAVNHVIFPIAAIAGAMLLWSALRRPQAKESLS